MKSTKNIQIGDLLTHVTGQLMKVQEVYEEGVMIDRERIHISMVMPVPLTPDFLMKNGFREDRPGITYRLRRYSETNAVIVDVFFHNNGEVTASVYGKTDDMDASVIHCHCEYVHQLQNAMRFVGIEFEIEI